MIYDINKIAIVPKIRRIRIKNRGIIENADIKFKDSLMVIYHN